MPSNNPYPLAGRYTQEEVEDMFAQRPLNPYKAKRMIGWHATYPERIPSILKMGLIPRKLPPTGQDWEPHFRAIYFHTSVLGAITELNQESDMAVLLIDMPFEKSDEGKLVPDEDVSIDRSEALTSFMFGGAGYEAPIPPDWYFGGVLTKEDESYIWEPAKHLWNRTLPMPITSKLSMEQVGQNAWSVLHQWADEFKAASEEVNPGCTCGEVAVGAMRGFHDAVNVSLGKPLQHPQDLQRLASFLQEVIRKRDILGMPAIYGDDEEDEEDEETMKSKLPADLVGLVEEISTEEALGEGIDDDEIKLAPAGWRDAWQAAMQARAAERK